MNGYCDEGRDGEWQVEGMPHAKNTLGALQEAELLPQRQFAARQVPNAFQLCRVVVAGLLFEFVQYATNGAAAIKIVAHHLKERSHNTEAFVQAHGLQQFRQESRVEAGRFDQRSKDVTPLTGNLLATEFNPCATAWDTQVEVASNDSTEGNHQHGEVP